MHATSFIISITCLTFLDSANGLGFSEEHMLETVADNRTPYGLEQDYQLSDTGLPDLPFIPNTTYTNVTSDNIIPHSNNDNITHEKLLLRCITTVSWL
jgi:hypothetical protein